ncbi:MAG TPA: hypothetical protein VMT12_16920 [Syntrophales bacterium]|nr:hypothetical protein [Syntrophales bacterium]
MKAYKINKYIICADTQEEAKGFFRNECREPLPAHIEEMGWECAITCESGENTTIRDIINCVLDERNTWLRMGVPCDLHHPFIIVKLP